MRLFFGRLLYRLGLRLCGIPPGKAVVFAHESFNPLEVAQLVGVVTTLPVCPKDVIVGIPTAAWFACGDGTWKGSALAVRRLFYRKAEFIPTPPTK